MEEEERAVPQFRGPEGTLDFSIHDLKKFTIEIIRKPSSTNEDLTRSIINPDNIVPVRRPGKWCTNYSSAFFMLWFIFGCWQCKERSACFNGPKCLYGSTVTDCQIFRGNEIINSSLHVQKRKIKSLHPRNN